MKKFNFLVVLLMGLVIGSCQKEEVEIGENLKKLSSVEKNNVGELTKKEILGELKLFSSSFSSVDLKNKIEFSDDRIRTLGNFYENTLNEVKEKGIEVFLIEKDILKSEDLEIVSFYIENVNQSSDIYKLIKQKFINFDNEKNKNLIKLIETTNIVYEYYNINYPKSGLSWRCAFNIAGSLVATAGLSSIPGPGWMFGIALTSKIMTTASMIDTCVAPFLKVEESIIEDKSFSFERVGLLNEYDLKEKLNNLLLDKKIEKNEEE